VQSIILSRPIFYFFCSWCIVCETSQKNAIVSVSADSIGSVKSRQDSKQTHFVEMRTWSDVMYKNEETLSSRAISPQQVRQIRHSGSSPDNLEIVWPTISHDHMNFRIWNMCGHKIESTHSLRAVWNSSPLMPRAFIW